jgi:hypothetical protein
MGKYLKQSLRKDHPLLGKASWPVCTLSKKVQYGVLVMGSK